MRLATLILITSFIIKSVAVPFISNVENVERQCSLSCIDSKKFDYEIGKTYIYEYVAETETKLQSKGSEISSLRIRTKAEIQPISKCDFVLRLTGVSLETPNVASSGSSANGEEFRVVLEKHSLRFGFVDGRIDNICPNENDPIWALNIKKGLLSTFQNSMTAFGKDESIEEVDVTGKCLTHYKVIGGTWLSDGSIHKTKDLLSCTNRTDQYTSLQLNSLNPKILSRTTPLVKSTHSCEQKIKYGFLKQAICKEDHTFQPFSNEQSGAVSTNIQTLTFVTKEERKISPIDFVSKRSTLLFEHKFRHSSNSAERQLAENSLKTLCAAATNDIRPEVPRLFSELVHRLQELNYETLFNIYKNVDKICNGNPKARKFLYDAIPLTGSDAGVTLMKDFILRKEISKAEADSWLLLIGFLPRPSKEIISSLMPLLDDPEEHSKGLLGISALTHSYCKTKPDCGEVLEVQQLVKKLANNLNENCYARNDTEKETMVLSLKALGNIGYIQDALPILEKCYRRTENQIEIRTSALDALRRLSCEYNRDPLHDVFFNYEEDSEVRIGAYLALMKCPTHQLFVKVRENLDSEAVNQVGSFVWTHLTALQETSDPNKQDLKNILSNKTLRKKFSTDVRKFSRYYEGSIFMDSLKVGAVADGNVIFSPKSYLPRSGSLGLTVDIFGESLNLFEIGGRVEGFEFIFESLFGPNGYFPDDAILKILNTAREDKSYDEAKLNEIEKRFNVKQYSENDPKGSLFMRIFGNDIELLQFRGMEQLLHRSTTGFNILQELIQLTQKESEYTKNFMFLDSTFILPTSVGLPLNLTVNGTTTVNLRVGGKLDLSQIHTKSLKFKADVQPSAAVEISSSMLVDAFMTRSGLKMTSSMHTSTHGNVEIVIQKGEILQAKINAPRDKIEVFDIRSNVYLIDGHEERKHASLVSENVHKKKCTGKSISDVLGIQLCGELEYPLIVDGTTAPPFILAGPLAAKLYLMKTDKELSTYNLEYRWDKKSVGEKHQDLNKFIRTGRFSVNTPKSSINREILAEYIYNEDQNTILVNFVTPVKKLLYTGFSMAKTVDGIVVKPKKSLYVGWDLVTNMREKRTRIRRADTAMGGIKMIDSVLKVDDEERLSLHSELSVEETENSLRISPNFNFQLNGKPMIDIRGYTLLQDDKKYSAEFTVKHITSQPVVVSGFATKNIAKGKYRYDADMTIDSQPVFVNAKWFVQAGDAIMSTKGTFDYRWLQGERHLIAFHAKSNRFSDHQTDNLNVEAGFQCSAHPNINLALLLENKRTERSTETTFELTKGPSKINVIDIQYSHDYEGSLTEHIVKSSLKISCLPANVDFAVELNHELSKKAVDTTLTLKSGSSEEISVILSATKNSSKQELIRGLAKITWPKHIMEINGNILQPNPGDLISTVKARWDPNAEATAVLTLKNHGVQSESWGHKLIAELTLPGQDAIILSGDVLLNEVEQRFLGEVQFDDINYKTFAEYHRPSVEDVRVRVGVTSPTSKYVTKAELYNSATEKRVTADLQLGHHRHIVADANLKRGKRHIEVSLSSNFNVDQNPNSNYSVNLEHSRKDNQKSQGFLTVTFPTNYKLGFSWNVSKDVSEKLGRTFLSGHYEVWFGEQRMRAYLDLGYTLRSSSRHATALVMLNTPFSGMGNLTFVFTNTDDGIGWNNMLKVLLNTREIFSMHSEGRVIIKDDGYEVEANVKFEPHFVLELPIIVNVSSTKIGQETAVNCEIHLAQEKQLELKYSHVNIYHPYDLNRKISFDLTSPYAWIKHLSIYTHIILGKKTAIQSNVKWNDYQFSFAYTITILRNKSGFDSYHHAHATTLLGNKELFALNLKRSFNSNNATAGFGLKWDDGQKGISLEVSKTHVTSGSQSNVSVSLSIATHIIGFRSATLEVAVDKDVNEFHSEVKSQVENDEFFKAKFDLQAKSPNNVYCSLEIDKDFYVFKHLDVKIHYFITESQFTTELRWTLDDDIFELSMNLNAKQSKTEKSKVYNGVLTIKVPHPQPHLGKFKLTVKHVCQPNLWNTSMSVEGDNKDAHLTHSLTVNSIYSFDNNLVVSLPFEGMKNLRLRMAQDISNYEFVHQSEVSLLHDYKYNFTLKAKLHKYGNLLFRSPYKDYTINIASVRQKEFNKFVFTSKGFLSESEFGVSLEYNSSQNASSGVFELNAPFISIESAKLTWAYDRGLSGKSRNLVVNWNVHPNNRPVSHHEHWYFLNSRFFSEILFNSAVLKLNLDNTNDIRIGKLLIGWGDHTIQLSGESKLILSKRYFNFTLTTTFEGYEVLNVLTEVSSKNSEKHLIISGTTASGDIKIDAFHNTGSHSMDAGITFTSFIPGFEKLYIGSHFVVNSPGESKVQIRVEKEDFITVLDVEYGLKPLASYINITFTSPIPELKLLQLTGKYDLSEEKVFEVSFVHNSKSVMDFKAKVMGNIKAAQVVVTLTTFVKTLEKFSFIGRHDLTEPRKYGTVTAARNNAELNVKIEFQNLPQKSEILISVTSPMERLKNLIFHANISHCTDALKASVDAQWNSLTFEAIMESSWTKVKTMFNFGIKTTIPGYNSVGISLEYDSREQKKQSKILLYKEQFKISVEGDFLMATDFVEAVLTTTIPGYETWIISIKIDRTKPKGLYLTSFQHGSKKYQASWEFAQSATYLEYKVQWKTPLEDSMAYINYNLNGANAVTFDVKLIKHKTMMEVSGRLWKLPDKPKADGSIVFNTNYLKMISSSISGRCDFTGDTKELIFQFDFNGKKAEIMAFTKVDASSRIVNFKGSSSSPDWQTFSLSGTVDGAKAEKSVKLTLMRNGKKVDITGSLFNRPQSTQAQLTLSTPFYGYEQLSATITTDFSKPHKTVTAVVKKNSSTLLNLVANNYVAYGTVNTNIKIQSQISGIPNIEIVSTLLYKEWSKSLFLKVKVNDQSSQLNIKHNSMSTSGNVQITISGNLIRPLLSTENCSLEIKYDTLKPYIYAMITADGQRLYGITLDVSISNEKLLTVYYPTDKQTVISTIYEETNSSKKMLFNVRTSDKDVIKLSFSILRKSADFNIILNNLGTDLRFSANFDFAKQTKTISIKYKEGTNIFELGGHYMLESRVDTDRSAYESGIFLKTPWKRFENIDLSFVFEKSEKLFKLNSQIKTGPLPDQVTKLYVDFNYLTSFKVGLSSPLKGYESFMLHAVYSVDNTQQDANVGINWSSQKISLSYKQKPGKVDVVFVSSLRGYEHLGVTFIYGTDPLRSSLIFNVSPTRKIEMTVQAHLRYEKGTWSAHFLPLDAHKPFILEGSYDFALHQVKTARLLAEGQGNKIEATMKLTGDARLWHQLNIDIVTPWISFYKFLLNAKYSSTENDTTANVKIQANDKIYEATGRVINHEDDSFDFDFQTNSPVNGYELLSIKGQADMTGSRRFMDIFLNMDQQSVVTFRGEVKQRLPYEFVSTVRLVTPLHDTINIGWDVSYRVENTMVEASTTLLWKSKTIQLTNRLEMNEVTFTMTTPFSYLHDVRFHVNVAPNSRGFALTSTLDVDGNKSALEASLNTDLEQGFSNAKFEILTPFEAFKRLAATSNLKFGEPFSGNFTIETPFDIMPKAEVLYVTNYMDPLVKKLRLQVSFAELNYTVEILKQNQFLDYPVDIFNLTVIVKTPHQGYETITITKKNFYVDSAERGAELSLTTPTDKYLIRGRFVLKPENIGFEVFCVCPPILQNPLGIGIEVKHTPQREMNMMKIYYLAAGVRNSLTWNHTAHQTAIYKGVISLHGDSPLTSYTLSLGYNFVGSKSNDQFTMDINLAHEINSSKYNISSLSMIFGDMGRHLDVTFLLTEKYGDHKLAINYKLKGSTFDCLILVQSSRWVHRSLVLTGHITRQEADVVLTLGNSQTLFSMKYKIDISHFDGTVKFVDSSLKARLQRSASQLRGEVIVQDRRHTHSLVGLLNYSPKESHFRLNLRTPYYDINNFVLEGKANSINLEGKQKLDLSAKVSFRRQVHQITLSLLKDNITMDGVLKIQSPLLQSNTGVVVHIQLLLSTPYERHGLITVIHGKTEHKGEVNMICGNDELLMAEAKLKTPLWGIDSMAVKSKVLRDTHHNKWAADMVVDLPSASHSLHCELVRDPSWREFHFNIHTPYLSSEPYSLNAKVVRETKRTGLSVTLQVAEVNHTVSFFLSQKERGVAIQANINTPFLDIDEVTFAVTIIRIEYTGLDVAFELAHSSVVHTMNLTAWFEPGKVLFNATGMTPLCNLGRFVARGQISMPKRNQLNIDAIVQRSGKEYFIRGFSGLTSTGIIGDLQVNNLPYVGPIELQVNITKSDERGVEVNCGIGAFKNYHNVRGHLKRNKGHLDFLLKINSSLLGSRDFAVMGNISLQFPSHVECNSTSSPVNCHSIIESNVEGDFKLITPFQHLPFLRINGKVSRNPAVNGINGDVEMYMADEGSPHIAAHVQVEQSDLNNLLRVIHLRIPVLGYEHVMLHFGSQDLKDSRRYHVLKCQANDYAYGYEASWLSKPNVRKVNSKVFMGQRTYSLQTTLEKALHKCNLDFILETPIQHLKYIKYEIQYELPQKNHRMLQTSLSVNDLHYLIKGQLNYSDAYNFDSLATIEMPLKNFKKITIKIQQQYVDHHLRFSFEQGIDDNGSPFALLVDVEQKASNGSGVLQLSTPLQAIRTAGAYYRYDNFDNHINGDIGLNHNGRQVLEVKTATKDDVKVLEIFNPIQPITIQYSFVNRDGTFHVSGEYCWDNRRRSEASIGFSAMITVTEYGRHVIIRSIHPKRPVTMTFQLETAPTLFVQSGEITWGNTDTSITSYEIKMWKDISIGGKRTYDTTTRVILPFRALELTTHCESNGANHYSTTAFKWDAQKDREKVVIIKTQYENASTSTKINHWAEISVGYPKIIQLFIIRGEVAADRQQSSFLQGRLDIKHGPSVAEQFKLEGELKRAHEGFGYLVELKAAHPISKVAVKLLSEVINTNENAVGGIQLEYLTTTGQFKNLVLRNELHKSGNKWQTMMILDESKFNLTGQIQNLPTGYLLFLESKVNDENPVTTVIRLHRGNETLIGFSADYNQSNNRIVKFRGGMQDRKTIFAEANHQNGQNIVSDVSLSLNLNQSRNLVTQFNWRPGVLKELEDSVGQSLSDSCKSIRQYFKTFVVTTSNEFHRSYEDVRTSLGLFWKTVGDDMANEVLIWQLDSQQLREALNDLYISNDFYIRNICDWICENDLVKGLGNLMGFVGRSLFDIIESVKDSFRLVFSQIKMACKNMCKSFDSVMSGHIQDIPYAILHFAEQINEFGIRTVHELTLYGLKFTKDLLSLWIPPLNEFTTPDWIHRMSRNVNAQLQEYVEKFFNSIYYQKLVENYEDLVSTLGRMYNHEYIQRLRLWLSPLSELFESYANKLSSHPSVNIIKKVTEYIYNLSVWTYDFFKLEDRIKDFVSALVARGEDILLHLIQDMVLPEITLPVLKQHVVFEPENGKLKIIQSLPVNWNSFTELPTIYNTPEFEHILDFKDNLIRLPKTSMNKLFQAVASEFSWNHLVPKYRSRALLVGTQHYMTFDGRGYEFAGECTYLLVHDFVNKNFTAVVKYRRENEAVIKEQFTIFIDGQSIDIWNNLTVVINNTQQNLPLTLGQTQISLTEKSLEVSNNAKQIWIQYDKQADAFMLEIGGFYHGKTAGLFGNFDHEPFNDLTKPDNTKSISLEDFAASWEVGSTPCASKRNYAYKSDVNSYALQKTCNDMFNKYSTLTPCLRKLNPSPYKNMCLNDVAAGKSPCSAVLAYTMMCNVNGIAVSAPTSCCK